MILSTKVSADESAPRHEQALWAGSPRSSALSSSALQLNLIHAQAVPGLGPMDDPRRDKLRIQQCHSHLLHRSRQSFLGVCQDLSAGKPRTLVIGNVGCRLRGTGSHLL